MLISFCNDYFAKAPGAYEADMAKIIAVELGGLLFPSKSAAMAHFRNMLHRNPVNGIIPDPDASELASLLERHPEVADKIGSGISHFSVRNALYGTRCFEVVRTNGTSTDFSFKTCVDGTRPSDLSEAVRALRAEVTEDILEKKREWFRANADADGKVQCAISGRLISPEEAHADHAPPRTFGTLAVTFLAARRIIADASFVIPPADNQYQPTLSDRALANEWRSYHHDLAVIRIVARTVNLSGAANGKVKKRDRQIDLTR
jgi:hypothetical protein